MLIEVGVASPYCNYMCALVAHVSVWIIVRLSKVLYLIEPTVFSAHHITQ